MRSSSSLFGPLVEYLMAFSSVSWMMTHARSASAGAPNVVSQKKRPNSRMPSMYAHAGRKRMATSGFEPVSEKTLEVTDVTAIPPRFAGSAAPTLARRKPVCPTRPAEPLLRKRSFPSRSLHERARAVARQYEIPHALPSKLDVHVGSCGTRIGPFERHE